MKQTIEASLTIRCCGPAYNPCGREATIPQWADMKTVVYDPLRNLPDGWGYMNGKILCGPCLSLFLNDYMTSVVPQWFDTFMPPGGE